jgi:hypothetical protein
MRPGLVTIAACAGALSAPAAVHADEVCGPAAIVWGDEAATRELQPRLAAAGIDVTPAGECDAVQVEIADRNGRLDVTLIDGEETIARQVASLDAAAAWIESWLRPDLAEPLLAPRPVAGGPQSGSAGWGGPEGHEGPSLDGLRTIRLPRFDRPTMSFGVGVSAASGDDASTWSGLDAGGCVFLGPVCAGIGGSIAGDGGDRGTSEISARATAPIRLSHALSIAPSIGVGIGRTDAAAAPMCTDDDPANEPCCGDGVCDGDEDVLGCAQDCASTPPGECDPNVDPTCCDPATGVNCCQNPGPDGTCGDPSGAPSDPTADDGSPDASGQMSTGEGASWRLRLSLRVDALVAISSTLALEVGLQVAFVPDAPDGTPSRLVGGGIGLRLLVP